MHSLSGAGHFTVILPLKSFNYAIFVPTELYPNNYIIKVLSLNDIERKKYIKKATLNFMSFNDISSKKFRMALKTIFFQIVKTITAIYNCFSDISLFSSAVDTQFKGV